MVQIIGAETVEKQQQASRKTIYELSTYRDDAQYFHDLKECCFIYQLLVSI